MYTCTLNIVAKIDNDPDNYNDLLPSYTVLDSSRKKTINIFAIVLVLLIAVPEIVGHTLFDKAHPENSSVVAALALANKFEANKHSSGPSCNLVIQNDTSGAGIVRAAGLQGQYGNFTCTGP
ncbi:MAG: hypothetical protein PXX83_08815 [Candidatus Nitrosotalea sp.]|nr:hypothetical protein [Candidatus Nitrosotalea sp.]